MTLFTELKRRNVFKVGLLYMVASWLVLQVADVLFDQLGVPGWAFRFVFGLLLICFPLVLMFSWVYELTPEGLRREKEVAEGASITHHTGQRINRVIVVLLVLAIATVVADRLIPERGPAATPAEQAPSTGSVAPAVMEQPEAEAAAAEKSIAVLPFVNMSGDPENEYFSDGLTEELLNALARLGDLKVAGRTSSFAFKGLNTDLREIARQLDVANLLEGSVRKAGNRVRITAQLVKASDGYHLWSETFDRELEDIFAIQEEIAETVAGALHSTLGGVEDKPLVNPHTDRPAAYEAYLRGHFIFGRAPDDEATRQRAEAEFQRALELDPDFALARWGLFRVLDFRHRNGAVDFEQGALEMQAIAERLVTERPDLVESQLAVGRAAMAQLKFAEALQAYANAVDLNPGHVDALTALGSLTYVTGSYPRAEVLLEDAMARDPLALTVLTNVAWLYNIQGRCEDVRRIRQRALAVEPAASRVSGMFAYCLIHTGGDLREAMQSLDKEPVDFIRQTGQAIALRRLGDSAAAEAMLERMRASYGDAASYQYGQIYAHWDQPGLAIEWLEKAYATGDPGIINLLSDPMLAPLRTEDGYLRLLANWKAQGGL